jgi:hypothetical protein
MHAAPHTSTATPYFVEDAIISGARYHLLPI